MTTRPTSWLRASRRVRLVISEISWAVINIAGAGAACGVCYAVWIIISVALERNAK